MPEQVLPPPLGSVSQVAYVVRDLEAALKYWVEVIHAGPFFLFEHAEMMNQRYRGEPSNIDVTLAVGNSGDTQIELIYCEDGAPSVYQEFLQAGRSGVHHLGLMPEDFHRTCEAYRALGFEAAFECSIAGTDLVYFDTVAALGHFTELWDTSETFLEFQRSVREAARGWDGKDPIRNAAL